MSVNGSGTDSPDGAGWVVSVGDRRGDEGHRERRGVGAGDGIRIELDGWWSVSRAAIAGALALAGVSGGERLVAFALASYAGGEHRAWPGATSAATRAGLGDSRYLQARTGLARRGVIEIEPAAGGRGRTTVVRLCFAERGPWWEGEVNPERFESVLSRSRARGPARLVLAALAALADGEGVIEGVSTGQVCAAAGVSDRTYRRARQVLLEAGELELMSGTGGRGHTNVWKLGHLLDRCAAERPGVARRVAPPPGARPLMASVRREEIAGVVAGAEADAAGGENAGQDRTVSLANPPDGAGISVGKGGQDRTLFELPAPQTPTQTPAQTPAANARAGGQYQNQGIFNGPPSPPAGGSSAGSLASGQPSVSRRGRQRRRAVAVDLAAVRRELAAPDGDALTQWEQIRSALRADVGESQFIVWLAEIKLAAVDREGGLVIAPPAQLACWVAQRFGGLLVGRARSVSRIVAVCHRRGTGRSQS